MGRLTLVLGLVVVAFVTAECQKSKVLFGGFGLAESSFDYHEKIGIKEASRIRKEEEKMIHNVKLDDRIAGGEEIRQALVPYLAGLQIKLVNKNTESLCGSSIINSNRLVTAAHCWYDGASQAYIFTVVLGSQYLYYGGTKIQTKNVVTHPLWDPRNFANDIAIIYLSEKIQFTATIKPISLPTGSMLKESFVGAQVFATGYGKLTDLEHSVSKSTTIRQVFLKVSTPQECRMYFGVSQIRDTNICTSGTGGVGICGGDSGGPLVLSRNGVSYMIGISSFVAKDSCHGGHPSVFTRVTSYVDYIQRKL